MRASAWTVFVLIIFAGHCPLVPVSAQTHYVLHGAPIPMDFPTEITAPTFSERGTMTLNENGAIWVVSDLPPEGSGAVLKIQPTGNQAMAGSWRPLSESVAIYEATGGELVLVRDLPGNPTLVSTGIMSPLLEFRPVNETTAVACDRAAGVFHVLRHGPSGASLHMLASPVTLPTWYDFNCGPSGEDRYLALGGYLFREIVVVEGLAGPASGFVVTTRTLPAGQPLEGFCVTEAGTAVAWHSTWSASFVMTTARVLASGSGPTQVNTHHFSPPGFPIDPFPARIVPARGDDVLVEWAEDFFTLTSFVIDAGRGAQAVLHWDDDYPGRFVRILGPREVLLAPSELVFTHQATHHRFAPATSSSTGIIHEQQSLFVPGAIPEEALKVNDDTLVITAADQLYPAGARLVTTYTDLDGAAAPHTDSWPAQTPVGLVRLSSGLTAGLSLPAPGLSVEIHVTTAPAAYAVRTDHPSASSISLLLYPAPTVPHVGAPFALRLQPVASGFTDVFVAAASALGPPSILPAPFHPMAILHLDPSTLFGFAPAAPVGAMPGPLGAWAVNLDLQNLPPEAVGKAIYLQGVAFYSTFEVSNPIVVIPG